MRKRVSEKPAKTKRRQPKREPDSAPPLWGLTPAGLRLEQCRAVVCAAVGVEPSTPDDELVDKLCLLAYSRPASLPTEAAVWLADAKAQEQAARHRPPQPERVARLVAQLQAVASQQGFTLSGKAAAAMAAPFLGMSEATAQTNLKRARRRKGGQK